MDLFGHAALSLLVGRALPPRGELRKATTAGALAGGLLPDVDVVAYAWGAEAFRQYHQLFTHNLVSLAVLPAVSAGVLCLAVKKHRRWLFAAAYCGMAFHLLGDVIGLWPVPLLQPFSSIRVALFLLEQDFSLALDVILVCGAAATLWDPVAARAWASRLALGVTLAAAATYLLIW